jgi:hypothetical protein
MPRYTGICRGQMITFGYAIELDRLSYSIAAI